MKLVKHISFALATVAALAFSLCVFSACTGEEKNVRCEVLVNSEELLIFRAEEGDATVSVYDALVSLQNKGEITFDGYVNNYGFTVTEMNGTKQADDWSAYWSVYTTLGEYEGITYATEGYEDYITGEWVDATYTYDGVKYLYASYGVSGIPVVQGYSYMLRFVSL